MGKTVIFKILSLFFILLSSVSRLSATPIGKNTEWTVHFTPENLLGKALDSVSLVNFSTNDLTAAEVTWGVVHVHTDSGEFESILPVEASWILSDQQIPLNWSSNFSITANFLGYGSVRLEMRNKTNSELMKVSNSLQVTVIRPKRVIDSVFTYSVAILVSVIYINFGCAMDWVILRKTLRRPVGPAIGFISQFLFMPVISFFLAKVLFPAQIPMQLGMFFTGVCPAGGASNIWTYTLGGNLNLSITMTTISTLAAFLMMPAWIFTVGRIIFTSGDLTIPYARIGSIAAGLLLPLGVGFLIQRYLPKLNKIMVRILKPFSALLIAFIVIFAIITNLYLFKLFSWQIIVAGMGLPWLGYFCGMLFAKVLRQLPEDILAISIETGIQNTGIAIFMLRFSLGQPEADLTTVVPVAVAIMTPFPLLAFFIVKKVLKWRNRDKAVDKTSINSEDQQNGEPISLVS